MNLQNLIFPKSIAVIGASANAKKIGHTLSKNILKYGYRGKLYLVNPRAKKILGKKVYGDISEIPSRVDTAILCVPSDTAVKVLEECAKAKARSVVVIGAGFSEIGGNGKVLEERIAEISKTYALPVLGPNCLGFLNSANNLNASFAGAMPLPGHIGFLSQSGAILSAAIDWARQTKIGFSQCVSLGNKTVLDEVPFLEYFENDKNTHIVFAYLEGVERGSEFMKAVKKLTVKKPLVVLKAGRTRQGTQAAASHTGSLAGDDKIFSEAIRASGAIEVRTLEEFFHLALFLSRYPMPQNSRIAVVSNAGGLAVLATDLIVENGLELASLSHETQEKLRQFLPKAANVSNPVDIVGDADAQRYKMSLETVVSDPYAGIIFVILTPQTVTEVDETASAIASLAKKSKKPFLAAFLGGKRVVSGIEILRRNQIPTYGFPSEAVSVIKKIGHYLAHRSILKTQTSSSYKKVTPDLKKFDFFEKLLQKEKEAGALQLSFEKAYELLKIYEIPSVKSVIAHGVDSLNSALKEMEYPLVAKVVSPDIIHKSDVGGVILRIQNFSEAKAAYEEIEKNVKKNSPKAKIDSVLFQEMAQEGIELILGAKRDRQFGPVALLGAGGIYTEIFQDVSIRFVPVQKIEAEQMIENLKLFPVLKGARGKVGHDLESVVDIILKLSQLMQDFRDIREIDLNPCVVFEKKQGAQVLDFRIIL